MVAGLEVEADVWKELDVGRLLEEVVWVIVMELGVCFVDVKVTVLEELVRYDVLDFVVPVVLLDELVVEVMGDVVVEALEVVVNEVVELEERVMENVFVIEGETVLDELLEDVVVKDGVVVEDVVVVVDIDVVMVADGLTVPALE